MNLATKLLVVLSNGGAVDIALPSSNRLAIWFAGNGLTIPSQIEAASAVPITEGGAIAKWNDLSATYAPTQSVAGARPTYHKSGFSNANRGYADFDGGDNLSQSIAAGIVGRDGLPNFSLYIVFTSLSTTLNIGLYGEGKQGSGTPFFDTRLNGTSEGRGGFNARASDSTFSNGLSADVDFNDGNPHLITVARSGNDTTLFKDGGAVLATDTDDMTAKTFGLDRLSIGSLIQSGTVSNQFIGKIALIAAYNEARNTSTEATIKSYYSIA